MKILQINTIMGQGSTGRIASDIHDMLKANKSDSMVAYGRQKISNGKHILRIGNNCDNYTHLIRTRLFDSHGFGSKSATIAFLKKVDIFNPDVIHLHNIHGYYINVALLFDYIKRKKKRVVWTLHDCWAFTGHCSYFDSIKCDRWKSKCYRCPLLKDYPKSIWKDRSTQNYYDKQQLFSNVKDMTIVTPSKWLSRLVEQSFLKDYKTIVINNGIDLKAFSQRPNNFRSKYNLENMFIILGVASQWNDRKGYEYMLHLNKYLNDDEVVVIVGVTEKQKKMLPKNYIGIKRTNNVSSLAEIYSSANVYINPTLEDNFPTTNLEALACGNPVITFNSGGSPESVEKKTGLVVDPGDTLGLVKAISIMREPENLFSSVNCIESAKSKYNKDERFKDYLKLYETITKMN
jgi:putative colanic acid biosynthesis glycosyltransferase